MKKLLLYLSIAIIFLTSPTIVIAENNQAVENSSLNTNENLNTNESDQVVDPLAIRNQNFLVPTKQGVQKANQYEADKIKKLEDVPLEGLTKSYLLGDYKSGKIMEGYNLDEVRAMASTSKLVSIFVVLDKVEDGTISLNDEVKIDHEVASLTGSSFKLKEGDNVSVEKLIEASMVVSGNDAITALAKYIGGTTDGFVKMMNEKCKDLGLKNALMVNPTGLTNYEITDYNKMTTREMFKLASELLKYHPEVLKYTNIEKLEEPERNFIEYNTNPVLGIVPEVDGLKTGYTNAAGRCVILTGLKKGVDEKSKDMRLICITTGSNSDFERFVACKRLITKGFEDYGYNAIGDTKKEVRTIEVLNSQDENIPVYQKKVGYILSKTDEKFKEVISIDENLKAPIERGSSVGKISFYKDDNLIYTTDLIVKDKVYERGIFNKFKRVFEEIFVNIEKAA
ncbi:D-alanyl-D-alanine carboxypeptidase [Peptoniphilus sp. AGMB00490]|uniref:serine-type D-Ala-D-Ala carboxypeptidase n=1 Tax=Peptoniphilus faecalis TaxID=2731255 RepID=A0A848RJI0_9FIRM|nr:D-alanyl-D-alanine carboxypeptidase family protein [Peptoniphilus faecalis]NMW86145.1 D-alanyl-D-alanine carboxypeptidase [Peptoniphilus faecalis]